jgi:uncharacterized membrane protein (DUF106 family)
MSRYKWCLIGLGFIIICAFGIIAYTQTPALWVLVGSVIIGLVARLLCRS